MMTDVERLAAIDAIRAVKAKYFRGVDKGDGDLVRSILAEDCRLDYLGCCTDPASGRDVLPQMNVVLEGRDNWRSDAFAKASIVSVHHGHQSEIEVLDARRARGIWAMTDQMFFPEESPITRIVGHGYYHETYTKVGDDWFIATLRIERLRVEAII